MKTDKANIESVVREVIADRLDIDINKIKRESLLKKDLGMDSFGAVELTFELKDKFGIEIPQDDFVKINKVEDIINYMFEHLN